MNIDNTGGGHVWVPGDEFGPLRGELLHLSYGTCSLFLVLKEQVDGVTQGGVVRFPLQFASSLMRGRFQPRDGQLTCLAASAGGPAPSATRGAHEGATAAARCTCRVG